MNRFIPVFVLVSAVGVFAPTGHAQTRPSIADLQARIATLEASSVTGLSSYVSVNTSDPARPAVLISNANLQVVNGLGSTRTVNGLGNLLIGYDEPRPSGASICSIGGYGTLSACNTVGGVFALNHKSGSHNLVCPPASTSDQAQASNVGHRRIA